MKPCTTLLLACSLMILGTGGSRAADDDAAAKDRQLIAGNWKVLSIERDGKKTPADVVEKTQTSFTAEGKGSVKREGKVVVQVSMKLAPAKSPKQVDTLYTDGELKGKTVLGIYEVSGDDMKYCYGAPGKDRPTEFSSKAGSGQTLIVYKRAK